MPLLLGIEWMDPNWLLDRFGTAFFWVSLVIIFVECGLFFPFLPGRHPAVRDGAVHRHRARSTIFPAAPLVELASPSSLLTAAAFLGNVVGYEIGRASGHRSTSATAASSSAKYFDQTEAFFDKHGSKALVIGRFVPFVRTYITVVAGVTRMDRRRFLIWSLVGAVLWVVSITLLGYFLGQRVPVAGREHRQGDPRDPRVLGHPVAYEWWRHRRTTTTSRGQRPQTARPTATSPA